MALSANFFELRPFREVPLIRTANYDLTTLQRRPMIAGRVKQWNVSSPPFFCTDVYGYSRLMVTTKRRRDWLIARINLPMVSKEITNPLNDRLDALAVFGRGYVFVTFPS